MIVFPEYIKEGAHIRVVAPSAGVTKDTDIKRFHNAEKKLKESGFKVSFSDSVFKTDGHDRSSDKKIRAKEFMEAISNQSVKYICSAKGGDYLMEMLPYLDYDLIKKNPKWFQGFSDNTGLCFSITTRCDTATVYCNNFGDFGMDCWHESVTDNLSILMGRKKSQNSFNMYEDGFYDRVTGLEGYNLVKDTCIYSMDRYMHKNCTEYVSIKGRLLGGCSDVIFDLAGTAYEDVNGFVSRNSDEKILWYFESFAANSEAVTRGLWKLRQMGWFENASGFLFGRPMFPETFTDTSYEMAVYNVIGDMGLPCIFGLDIGHKAPQWTIINGAVAEFKYSGSDNRATLTYINHSPAC